MRAAQLPTRFDQQMETINRRLLGNEKRYNEKLMDIRLTGHTFLKPPGVKKTMADLAQEQRETSNVSHSINAYDQGFVMNIPNASLNNSMIHDDPRSSFASWQTFDESESFVALQSEPPAANPGLTRSPILNFAAMQDDYDESIFQDSIHIHQD